MRPEECSPGQPKVLFLPPEREDYLADGLFHGLRTVLGEALVDYPKRSIAYRGATELERLHGRGFTLYGLLPDVPVERPDVLDADAADGFDVVVFGDVWERLDLFHELRRRSDGPILALLDGSDSPVPFPYTFRLWRARQRRSLDVNGRVVAFKRELTPRALFRLYVHVPRRLAPRLPRSGALGPWELAGRVPERLARLLPFDGRLLPLAFAVPEAKIVTVLPEKRKPFTAHAVDRDVAPRLRDASADYVFERESDYYADLRSSFYGITTKRAGWDCLRHYEIAANACVPCFRELERKPDTSAPHGLVPGVNCLSYSGYDDLTEQVASISPDDYVRLQAAALMWARQNSTSRRASEFLVAVASVRG